MGILEILHPGSASLPGHPLWARYFDGRDGPIWIEKLQDGAFKLRYGDVANAAGKSRLWLIEVSQNMKLDSSVLPQGVRRGGTNVEFVMHCRSDDDVSERRAGVTTFEDDLFLLVEVAGDRKDGSQHLLIPRASIADGKLGERSLKSDRNSVLFDAFQ